MRAKALLFTILVLILFSCNYEMKTQNFSTLETDTISIFPNTADTNPGGPSPCVTKKGREFILAGFKNKQFSWFDVTVENADTLNYKKNWQGKGMQLKADEIDFPSLAKKGLHSKKELRRTLTITGYSVSEITYHGRPMRSSGAGFMAEDETILSVLSADNMIVERLGLTHPDLAQPLFHLWNTGRIMEQAESKLVLDKLVYNGRDIKVNIPGSRGWQESIFDDEILGSYHLEASRELEPDEENFLKLEYGNLSSDKYSELKHNITNLHTGEMVAFYINRYGFYEGHTDFRADPVQIAFVFGIRKIEELHEAVGGDLYSYFNGHFIENPDYYDRRPRRQDPSTQVQDAKLSGDIHENQTTNIPQQASIQLKSLSIDSLVSALASAGRRWNGPAEKLIDIGDPAVPALLELLFDKSETQWSRRVAAMTLNRIHSPLALDPGLKLLFDEDEEMSLRNQIIPSLNGFEMSHVKEQLWDLFNQADNDFIKGNIAGLLKSADTALAYRAYYKIYNEEDGYVQMEAMRSLAMLRPHESTYWYLQGLINEDWWTSKTAIDSLISLNNPDLSRMEDLFNQSDSDEFRWKITYVFSKLKIPESDQFLKKAIMDTSWLVKMEALASRRSN